ncbi:hypothetical protein BC834DRAFT_538792 [Gloeopeniophorella convolvens]|nr:hypothetical protein BC834DRAFT_538792 [Gloeopeniophorella convolvens]
MHVHYEPEKTVLRLLRVRALPRIVFLLSAEYLYGLAFTPLIISYTVEILPYPLRAKGLTIFNFTISCALIFNQYINPIALDHISWKYYIASLRLVAPTFPSPSEANKTFPRVPPVTRRPRN